MLFRANKAACNSNLTVKKTFKQNKRAFGGTVLSIGTGVSATTMSRGTEREKRETMGDENSPLLFYIKRPLGIRMAAALRHC